MMTLTKRIANLTGRKVYIGNTINVCGCHGSTMGYAWKIEGLISFSKQKHCPWIRLKFGKDAKIEVPHPDEWKEFKARAGA